VSKNLFNEFNLVSAKEWKQKIQVELNGADYNETLVWNSNEEISVKPFYHKDEFEQLDIPQNEQEPLICQTIKVTKQKEANCQAIDAIKNGVDAIKFIVDEPFDCAVLFNGLNTVNNRKINLHFQFSFLSESFIQEIIAYQDNYNIFFNIDIIGHLAKTGNWFYTNKRDHFLVQNIINNTKSNVIGVDSTIYQNAGANCIQQIAYALSHANEYLSYFGSKVAHQIQFNVAIGSNYFFEIAKLRAFKFLWFQLLKEYRVTESVQIFAEPSRRNKTIYDYNVNMLRTTTECMSAMLGGASTISNLSYDAVFKQPNGFGKRIAKNQLLIIQEESYFKEALNFAEGSYYIETLTKQMTEKALKLFNDIENSGGFVNQLTKGIIQRKIRESALKEQRLFDEKSLVLVGTNKYQNKEEALTNDIEINPFSKRNPIKTIIEPIITRRLSEKIEQERLNEEVDS